MVSTIKNEILADNLYWQIGVRHVKVISSNNKFLTVSSRLLYDVIVTRYFDATLFYVDAAAMLRYFKGTNTPAYSRYLSRYVANDGACLVQERNRILFVWITFFMLALQFFRESRRLKRLENMLPSDTAFHCKKFHGHLCLLIE